MRWRALMLGGACVAFPLAALGCSLVASLDGLSGNEPDAGTGFTTDGAGGPLDATRADSGAAGDSAVGDTGDGDTATPPDTGTTPFDAALAESGAPEADAPAADAPRDVVTEPPPVPPIAFVQIAASSPPGMVGSVTAKLALAQVAGNLAVVAVGWNDATSVVSTVTDTSGNTYALAVGTTRVGTDISQAVYYARNIAAAAAGANAVTVFFVQPANVVDLRVVEYSGLDPAARSTRPPPAPAPAPVPRRAPPSRRRPPASCSSPPA